MAFQTRLNFPVKKRSSLAPKYRDTSCAAVTSPKRVLFGSTNKSVSPPKKCRQDENCENIDAGSKTKRTISSAPLFATAKQVFHAGQSCKLVGRSEEMAAIDKFIEDHVEAHEPGSMYISGAPGTGKTTCLMSVLKSWEGKVSHAFLNCMSLGNAIDIYKSAAKEFKLPLKVCNSKRVKKALEDYIVSSKQMNVLILDEIDQLDTKSQEVLYTLFEWPKLKNSSLILIGIANALDLTERLLPSLKTFMCNPTLMHFQPYTKDQIVSILEDRLSRLKGEVSVTPYAVQLCARKIAACTGDIRKALDVCRRAVEVVESKNVLKSTSDDRSNPGSPMKASKACVDIPDINAVLHEVYGSRLQTSEASTTVTMPLQQMLVLCTLILLKKNCKRTDMTLGKLYDVYRRICQKRDIAAVSEFEFSGLCSLVEARGFILLKQNKVVRMTKIELKIDEKEAEFLFQDKAMLPSVLSDKSVLNRC